MKTSPSSTPIFFMPSKKDFNSQVFEKKLLEILGITSEELKENNITTTIEIFTISRSENFITVDNGRYGAKHRREFLRLGYDKIYCGSEKFLSCGVKVTLDEKIDYLRSHARRIMNNKNINVNLGAKIKEILPENGLFRFISASMSNHDGVTTTTISLGLEYGLINKFDISVHDAIIKIEEKNNEKNYDYNYSVSFSKLYGRKDGKSKIDKFSNGLTELENKFNDLINNIKSLK